MDAKPLEESQPRVNYLHNLYEFQITAPRSSPFRQMVSDYQLLLDLGSRAGLLWFSSSWPLK